MILWYLPLEPYRERYTEMLAKWMSAACERCGVAARFFPKESAKLQRIGTGRVLDVFQRCSWSLRQMAEVVEALFECQPPDVIFIEDMFNPGYEALPYILWQRYSDPDLRPAIWTRNYAQSVDPDDFTYPMQPWMRPYEEMVDRSAQGVFVASQCHKEMMQSAGLTTAKVEVVGLPFDSFWVRANVGDVAGAKEPHGEFIVYSSRLDREKQPHFMLAFAKRMHKLHGIKTVICTGASGIRSNDPLVIDAVREATIAGDVVVRAGLSKAEYYATVAAANLHFNCAKQDFVSFTLLEASALGTPTLAPAFRSFPEALFGSSRQCYIPWNVEHAVDRALDLFNDPPPPDIIARAAHHHDGTFDRMFRCMKGI